ncbi:MAG: hypothetical protein JWO00_418 [Candidatus Parcubacteria bacterium]|nr:hypothetical protein [Candidatus Parcubacteria bacterium]
MTLVTPESLGLPLPVTARKTIVSEEIMLKEYFNLCPQLLADKIRIYAKVSCMDPVSYAPHLKGLTLTRFSEVLVFSEVMLQGGISRSYDLHTSDSHVIEVQKHFRLSSSKIADDLERKVLGEGKSSMEYVRYLRRKMPEMVDQLFLEAVGLLSEVQSN